MKKLNLIAWVFLMLFFQVNYVFAKQVDNWNKTYSKYQDIKQKEILDARKTLSNSNASIGDKFNAYITLGQQAAKNRKKEEYLHYTKKIIQLLDNNANTKWGFIMEMSVGILTNNYFSVFFGRESIPSAFGYPTKTLKTLFTKYIEIGKLRKGGTPATHDAVKLLIAVRDIYRKTGDLNKFEKLAIKFLSTTNGGDPYSFDKTLTSKEIHYYTRVIDVEKNHYGSSFKTVKNIVIN